MYQDYRFCHPCIENIYLKNKKDDDTKTSSGYPSKLI
jgi:hypothetical protein